MKLIRDKIPYLIEKNGDIPLYHVAKDEEYKKVLFAKLNEEIAELQESEGDIFEIADVLEVLEAIISYKGFSQYEVDIAKALKKKTNGSYKKRFVLESIKKREQ